MKSGLSAQQLEAFERDGFLVVEGVLSSDDLSGIEIEYAEIIEGTTSALVDTGSLVPLEGTTFDEKFVEARRSTQCRCSTHGSSPPNTQSVLDVR